MQTQTPKITKRAIRRRNRNKRRRKIRRQQKNAQPIEGKKQKVQNKLKLQPTQNIFSQESGKWEALCLETYQRLTSWQCEAELNFWKARAEYLQKENKQLKQQLGSSDNEDKDEALVDGTVLLKDDDDLHNLSENCDVDPGYLEFIAITYKHREDLKRSRANISEAAKTVEYV